MSATRYAVIGFGMQSGVDPEETIARYLPANYRVVGRIEHDGLDGVLIAGQDNAGWTLDDYVLPRLASGLYGGREVSIIQTAYGTAVR